MPDPHASLKATLHNVISGHLAKLEQYIPGPIKKAGGLKDALVKGYAADPMFSMWGLDSIEYAAATLGGGTITSIHRKLGDIYQDAVKLTIMDTLDQKADQVLYSARIRVGEKEENRHADCYIQFDRLADAAARQRIEAWSETELRKLTDSPRVTLKAVGMEIRSCYQSADKQRSRADVSLARHMMLSGILPVMPLFCNQSNPSVINGYRSSWIVKEGFASYEMVKAFSGFDLFEFLKENREEFRKPVIATLRRLTA